MKLIAGLGNPGREYATNRHNIGFLCINHLARKIRIDLDKKQSQARVGKGIFAGQEIILAKPQTYMNASGYSIKLLMMRYDVSLQDLIVIHDDLDLPLGKIRIRHRSSAGGHNGIKSIIANIGTQDFIRIKVGIGRPQDESTIRQENIINYVLGDFSPEDRNTVESTIERVTDAVICLITQGITIAMNKFN